MVTGGKQNKRRRDRSAASQSSRGPYSEPDSVVGSPWHQEQQYQRFWQHYYAIMRDGPMAALHHAAFADCGGVPQRRKSRAKRRLCRKHRPMAGSARPGHGSSHRHDSKHVQHSTTHGTHHHHDTTHHQHGTHHRHDTHHHLQHGTHHRHGTHHQQHHSADYGVESEGDLTSQLRSGMHLNDDEDQPPTDENFLTFLEQTIRHREEWKNKKQTVKWPTEEGFVQQEEDETESKDHPDRLRHRAMQGLYGVAAPAIHAMETSMQLAFQRVATRHHTKLWPNIPVNIVYEDA